MIEPRTPEREVGGSIHKLGRGHVRLQGYDRQDLCRVPLNIAMY